MEQVTEMSENTAGQPNDKHHSCYSKEYINGGSVS